MVLPWRFRVAFMVSPSGRTLMLRWWRENKNVHRHVALP